MIGIQVDDGTIQWRDSKAEGKWLVVHHPNGRAKRLSVCRKQGYRCLIIMDYKGFLRISEIQHSSIH